jgi:hypothetical protein
MIGAVKSPKRVVRSVRRYFRKLRERAESRDTKIKRLTATLVNQKAAYERRIALMRMTFGVKNLHEEFDEFIANSRLHIPEKPLRDFLAKCKSSAASPERYEGFLKHLEETNYREIYEQLFASEIEIARVFDQKHLVFRRTFERGKADVEKARLRGLSMDDSITEKLKVNVELFDRLLADVPGLPESVESIIEIGPAWGAATRYFLNRFSPKTYRVYEIDSGFSDWLAANMPVEVMRCDGEKLIGTADRSMDIVLASSCLFFMPMIKQWSYLREMARVVRPGGLVMFNAVVADRLPAPGLDGLLVGYFPKRDFGLIPQCFIDKSFPATDFECLIAPSNATVQYELHRRLPKR